MKQMYCFSNALCFTILLLSSNVLSIKISSTSQKTSVATFNPLEISLLEQQNAETEYYGKWIRIKNMRTNKCLKSIGHPKRLLQEECEESDDFYFTILKNPDGSVFIFTKIGAFVIDNFNFGNGNGNPIGTVTIFVNDAQRWYIRPWGGNAFRFVNKGNNKCMDLSAGTYNNGEVIQLWDCGDGNQNQGWVFDASCNCSRSSSVPNSPLDSLIGKPVEIFHPKSKKCLKFFMNERHKKFDCDSSPEQAWILQKNDDGTYFIKSFLGEYVFDVFGSGTANTTPVISWRKHGGKNQRFKIYDYDVAKKSYFIRDMNSDKCLDTMNRTDNNSEYYINDCVSNNFNQEFIFRTIKPRIAKDIINQNYLDGKIVIIQNPRTKKCLKLKEPNGRLVQDECQNTVEYGWKFTFNEEDDNTYFITSIIGNYVFDNFGGRTHNGNEIITHGYHGGDNQRWFIDFWNTQSFYFKGKQSGKCIDVPGGTMENGASMQLWDCEIGTNQNQNFIFKIFIPSENDILAKLRGKWVQIINPKSGKCVKFTNGGDLVMTFDCYNLGTVSWLLNYRSQDNTYTITSYQENFSIENSLGKTDNGNPMITSRTSDSPHQKWRMKKYDNQSFFIVGVASEKCWDVPNGQSVNNLKIQLWDCWFNGNDNQKFVFQIVDPDMIADSMKNYQDKWYQIISVTDQKCIKFSANNERAIRTTCQDSDEFSWKIVPGVFQTYYIISKKGNYVLELTPNNYNSGSPIITTEKSDRETQRWYFIPWGNAKWRLVDVRYGKSIDYGPKDYYNLWETIDRNIYQNFELVPERQKVKVKGYVKNADRNRMIPFCLLIFNRLSITFSNDQKTYAAEVREGSSYEVTLPHGLYKRTVSLDKHYTYSEMVKISAASDESNNENTVYLSPIVEGWRFVLVWDRLPKDLNSNLVGPNGIVKYEMTDNVSALAVLDVDVQNGFGPETVTLKEVKDGLYKFYVHNFSKEVPLSESKAKVIVFHGNDFSQVIEISKDCHPDNEYYWHVLNIDSSNNRLVVVNQVKTDMN